MRHVAMQHVENKYSRKDVTPFRTGDTVRVHWKVREGEKERVQAFEGVVIRKKEGQNRASFTVRKISYGVGVERIFPLHSPRYERIEVLNHGNVNRNRLFYLRGLKGKAARLEQAGDELALTGTQAAKSTGEAAAHAEGAPKPKKAPKKAAEK